MKYLIACLGNIGAEYSNTRHNAGFRVADELLGNTPDAFRTNHLGSIAELKHKGRTFIVLKPSTYMNASGKAVNYWLQAEKISIENLLVIADDIALPFGTLRLKGSGSDGGHNGLKDIIQVLNSNLFARLRIGVGNNFARGRQVDYVLGEWTPEELQTLPAILTRAADAVKSFATIGLAPTMTVFNKAITSEQLSGKQFDK
ncbi:peptidyl-tRNA hydrolase [Bacteroidia bacterium]|nr:peptidyl-tRNA hydrolase [Bacteroidia bacterium]